MLFFSFPCFRFWNVNIKFMEGAWSLFTPGANGPQLKAEMQGKTGPRPLEGGNQEEGRRGWWRPRREVEGYLILAVAFLF